jgi:hypothetical protein
MSTISPTVGHLTPSHPASARIWRVVRLNTVNKRIILWTPLLVMAFILLINVAIWVIMVASTSGSDRTQALDGTQFSGGGFFIFVFMLVVGVQIITATFPFALGLSATRRDFFLGTSLTFVLLAAGYAIGFGLLSLVEEATNGWFAGGHLFTSVYYGDNVGQRMLVVFFGLLFCFFVGAVGGTLYMRWRTNGLLIGAAVLTVLLVGALAVVTFTKSWPRLGDAFASAGPVGIAAWLLIPAAVAAVVGYLALQKATPKD